MLGKIIGGLVGEKIAGPNRKLTGTLVGAAVPTIARRGFGPLVLIGAAAWGAKKFWDRRRERRDAA
jgi:hypothetical protein